MIFNITLIDKFLNVIFKKNTSIDLAKKSVILGIITSLFLVILKFIALQFTGSVSLLASMSDSIMDAFVSFLAFHALKFSSIKFDKSHNFGHEKVEGIMALFQCLVIFYSGIIIFREAYCLFLDPKSIENTKIGIIVMIISCFAVYQLLYFQKFVSLKTESALVKGDSFHYMSDFLMNICIIFSLLLSSFCVYIDAICGIFVGTFILYNAFLIMKSALMDLMDQSLDRNVQKSINDTVLSFTEINKIKILRTRSAGMKKYIEVRVIVEENYSLKEANKITDLVEGKLMELFEKVDVIVKAEIIG